VLLYIFEDTVVKTPELHVYHYVMAI